MGGQNQHQQVIMALFKVPLLLCLFTVVISASVVPAGNQEQNLAENEKNLPENVQNGPESLDFNLLSGGPRESRRTKTNMDPKDSWSSRSWWRMLELFHRKLLLVPIHHLQEHRQPSVHTHQQTPRIYRQWSLEGNCRRTGSSSQSRQQCLCL